VVGRIGVEIGEAPYAHALDDLGRRGLRMALVDRRQISEALDALFLEGAFVLVELRPTHPALSARFADAAEVSANSSTLIRCRASFSAGAVDCAELAGVVGAVVDVLICSSAHLLICSLLPSPRQPAHPSSSLA
jgi:hypothetical protein